MIRGLRTASTISRRFLRPYSSLPKRDGTFEVRHVRIHRPYWTATRIQRVGVVLLVLWAVYSKVEVQFVDGDENVLGKVEPAEVREAVKQVKKAAEGEKIGADGETTDVDTNDANSEMVDVTDEDNEDNSEVPEEQPEDALFIPLGWPRQVPRVFYKASDPEWQSFHHFAKDKRKALAVKRQLASFVGGHAANQPQLRKVLGNPIKIRQYWLDIDFPYGPPREYERPGIEITDDYVAWVARPVEPFNIIRLKRTLLPTPLLQSLWATSQAVWDHNVTRLKWVLDIGSPSSGARHPYGHPDIPELIQEAKKNDASQNGNVKNKDDKPSAGDKTDDKLPPSSSSTLDSSQVIKELLPMLVPGAMDVTASRVFKKTLSREWRSVPGKFEPPRGTIMVSGLVEVMGPKGVCVLDTLGAYDTEHGQWVYIRAVVRRWQPTVQKPLGGP